MGQGPYGLNLQEPTLPTHDCQPLTREASTLAPQG